MNLERILHWRVALLAGMFVLGCGLTGCGNGGAAVTTQPRPATLHVEGTLRHISPIPEPTTNEYKDCLFTAVLEVNGVQTGSVPERVILVMPAFLDRKLSAQSAFKTGQTLSARVCRFDELGRPFATMQQADTVEEIDLPLYFSDQTKVVGSFRAWTKPSLSITSAGFAASSGQTSASVSLQPSAVQREAIAGSIRRIHERRDAHGGWAAWDQALAPVIGKIIATEAHSPLPIFDVPFSVRSFRSLRQRFDSEDPERVRTTQALVQLRDGLALGGTELVLAPVPDRDLVGLDRIHAEARPADGIWNPHRLRRNLHLLAQGLELLDTTEAMRSAASGKSPLFFFESHDGHPAGGAVRVHGEAIAARLIQSNGLTPLPPADPELALSWHAIESPPAYPNAPFRLKHQHPLLRQGQTLHPDNPDSPILLFGDSYLKNPHGGGGVSDIVGAALNHVPHLLVRSSGAVEMPRHLARSRSHLAGKKVAVLVFNEALLDPHHESWTLVDFAAGRSEFERYVRLSASGRNHLNYNSQADFSTLAPREKPPGFLATPKRAYIPLATSGPFHVDCLPTRFAEGRETLVFVRVRTRHPQGMDILKDGVLIRSIPLTHQLNDLHLVLDLGGSSGSSVLSFRFPQGGGNLFFEALRVFETH